MGSTKGSAYLAVKYVFIVFNVLVWLLGFGVLSMGVWLHVNRAPYMTLLPNATFLSATVLVICAGLIVFVVGFCGCCGAILESQCMLVVYFTFVLVIFGFEVAATVLGVTHKHVIQQYIHEEIMLTITSDYDPSEQGSPNGGVVDMVDGIQREFECCGVDNHTDWYNIPAWSDQHNVPTSCCADPYPGCGQEGSPSVWYTRGCLKEMEYWFYGNIYTLGILALALAVVQVLAMTAAVAMFCCLRKNKAIL